MVVFLNPVLARYLAYLFWRSVLSATKIVIIGANIYQVFTHSRSTGYYTTQLLVPTILYHSLKILTRRLGTCFGQSNRLTVNRLSLFIFLKLKGFFFLIRLLTFPAIRNHFANTDRRQKWSLRFDLNRFIKYSVFEVQFSVSAMYLSLDR